jgi:chloramphenicol 3-O phosphotransferase
MNTLSPSLPGVIFLNGTSSAGKTSIARELQARLPEPYLHFGVDHVFPWLPPQWQGDPEGLQLVQLSSGEMPMRVGPGGNAVLRGWRRMVRAGLEAGLRFVVDEVFLTDDALTDWAATLAGHDVFFVGVRCDLAELQRRETARGDRGVGQALSQHHKVHAQGPYDFEVDTTATPTAACVDQILAAMTTRARPSVFERLARA